MTAKILVAAAVLAASASAQAQVPPLNFNQAAYVTCREAHAMQPQARQALAVYLADHAARYRGVAIPSGPRRLHAGARRLPVHGDRPGPRRRAREAPEAAIAASCDPRDGDAW